jgi:hypothetical protein
MAKSKFDRLLGAQLGFEDDDVTTAGDADEIISAAAQPESDIADMAPDVAEMEEASSTAEALTDSSAELEEVAEALSASAAAGGISTEAAVYARLAIRGIVGRHSMALADAMVPSMESFGGSSSRARATASMEGAIVEALKSFWNAIVAKMKKLYAYVKNWIMKVFGAAPKLKARAEAIAKKTQNITGAAEEKTMDLSLMHQLHINGKAPAPSDMLKTLKEVGEGAEASLGSKTSGQYNTLADDFDTLLNAVDGADYSKRTETTVQAFHQAKTSKVVATSIATAKAMVPKGSTASTDTRWGSDVEAHLGPETFGGKAVVVQISTLAPANGDFTLARFARGTSTRIVDHAAKPKDIDNSGSFKTLSSSEIRTACDEVADICDSVITYKKSWEAREKQFDKIDKAAKKAIANAEKDKDEVGLKPRIVKDIALGASTMDRIGVNFETQLVNYCLACARSVLTWCERSLSQYKAS